MWELGDLNYSDRKDSVKVSYLIPGKKTITLRAYNSNGIEVASLTKKDYITVFNYPKVSITISPKNACTQTLITFSPVNLISDTSIKRWEWNMGDGTNIRTQVPRYSYTDPGTYDIRLFLTDNNNCTDVFSTTVTVSDEKPIAIADIDKKIVCGTSLTSRFTNKSTGDIDKVLWKFGDGKTSTEFSPTHTYIIEPSVQFQSYIYSLQVTAKNGCYSTIFGEVKLVNISKPEITIYDATNIVKDGAKACPGNFTFETKKIQETNYIWDVFNDNILEPNNGTHTLSTTITDKTTVPVKLIIQNNGCRDSTLKTFEIEQDPKLHVNPSDLGKFVCIPDNVIIPAQYSSSAKAKTIEWILYNKTVNKTYEPFYGLSFSHQVTIPGVYDLIGSRIVTENNCVFFGVTYNDFFKAGQMFANYQLLQPYSGCAPLEVSMIDRSYYNIPAGIDSIHKIVWDFGDGSPLHTVTSPNETVKHTYNQAGEYPITIKAIANCSDSLHRDSVYVGTKPKINFSLTNTDICASETYSITDLSEPADKVDTLWVSFKNPNSKIGVAGNMTMGNPLKPNPIDIEFKKDTGRYDMVMYRVSYNGCRADTSLPNVLNVKGPICRIKKVKTNCETPYFYTFEIDTMIDATSWEWYIISTPHNNTVATITGGNPVYFNFNQYGRGDYRIKLIAKNENTGCTFTDSADVKVRDLRPWFRFMTPRPCLHSTVEIDISGAQDVYKTALSVRKGSMIYVSTSDKLSFIAPVRDTVMVTILFEDENGCEATLSKPLKIFGIDADFIVPPVSACLPFSLEFTDNTSSDTTIVHRRWFLDTCTVYGNETSVSCNYSEQRAYRVYLIAHDRLRCIDTSQVKLIVPLVPASDFTILTPKVCYGGQAEFVINPKTDSIFRKADFYIFNFGDNTTKYVSATDATKNIKHIYTSTNDYMPVTLTAYTVSPSGDTCSHSTTKTLRVRDYRAHLVLEDTVVNCDANPIFFSEDFYRTYDYADAQSIELWRTLNNSTPQKLKTIYPRFSPDFYYDISFSFYKYPGVHKLAMVVKTDYVGCEYDSAVQVVDVGGFKAGINVSKEIVCVDEEFTVTLKDTLNLYKYRYWWLFGDGNSSEYNVGTTQHSYSFVPPDGKGMFLIRFKVDEQQVPAYCQKGLDLQDTIKIYNAMADFDRGLMDSLTGGCKPFTVNFINNSVGANGYFWNFDDGTTSTETNPTHTFTESGKVYNVRLSIENAKCPDDKMKPVEIYKPTVTTKLNGKSVVCEGDEATIVILSGDFKSWISHPTLLFEGDTFAIVKPTETTTYYVNLEDIHGCTDTAGITVRVQKKPTYTGVPNSPVLYLDNKNQNVELKQNVLYTPVAYYMNNDSIPGVIYSWYPSYGLSCTNCANPTFVLDKDMTYTLTMTDSFGCFIVQELIKLVLSQESDIGMPTAFTPNKDGENDIALPRGWGIKEFIEMRIYNRWGQLVYQTYDITQGWDGTFKGKPQNQETFVWTIFYKDNKDETIMKKGYLTLLR
ncbi:MAG: PKD domain-containing protein [Bacteroidales bacterium]